MLNPQNFPQCLYIDPDVEVPGETEAQGRTRRRFNDCCWQFLHADCCNTGIKLSPREHGWLAAAAGINDLIDAWSIDADDDYLAADEVTSMLDSLDVLLNYDLDRLDAYRGRLSEWICSTKLRVHIHPDTGEYIGDEARAAYESEFAR